MRLNLLSILCSLLFTGLLTAQDAPNSGRSVNVQKDYYTASWEKTSSRASAKYFLEKEFVEAVMLIEGVPTYDDGLAMRTKDTPLARWLYNYYYVTNEELAFSVQVIALKEDPDQFQFDGSAVWYYQDGNLKAKGTYDSGKLINEYTEYDRQGNVTKTKRFVGGEEMDVTGSVHKPLVGKWVQVTTKDSGAEMHLFNEFRADGTLVIWSQNYSGAKIGGKKFPISGGSSPKEFVWKYQSGELEVFYPDGKLLGKEKLKITGDQFTATVTRHQSPSLVGQRYNFKRAK